MATDYHEKSLLQNSTKVFSEKAQLILAWYCIEFVPPFNIASVTAACFAHLHGGASCPCSLSTWNAHSMPMCLVWNNKT